MTALTLNTGYFTTQGCKSINQDFVLSRVPILDELNLKGAVFAISDGVGSSLVSQVASESAVKRFINDYYCTSPAWSVEHAGGQVFKSVNAHLYCKNQHSPYKYNLEKGYVCTFSALILQNQCAHIFHVGDSRIYRLRNNQLTLLTTDHNIQANGQTVLSQALGITPHFKFDYLCEPLIVGDVFLLMTDGIFNFLTEERILALLNYQKNDLNTQAKIVVDEAVNAGSNDNLTMQVVVINQLAKAQINKLDELSIPPILKEGDLFESNKLGSIQEDVNGSQGYKIRRVIHSSNRSHVYLALDLKTADFVIIKAPSVELTNNAAQLNRLLTEEWVLNKVNHKANNQHIVKAVPPHSARNFYYTVTEYIEGQTLAQFLLDNPTPNLEKIRDITEQIAKGLTALHKVDILHQDIRPENILIDSSGLVTIIDLGSANIMGVTDGNGDEILGTAMYTAPEYLVGSGASERSDLYSLAVLTYYMLSGRYPYGTKAAKAHNIAAQSKLSYISVIDTKRDIPLWLDATLKKALQPNPAYRYQVMSEFIYDLRHPNNSLLATGSIAWAEKNPVVFWRGLSLLLAISLVISWLVFISK